VVVLVSGVWCLRLWLRPQARRERGETGSLSWEFKFKDGVAAGLFAASAAFYLVVAAVERET